MQVVAAVCLSSVVVRACLLLHCHGIIDAISFKAYRGQLSEVLLLGLALPWWSSTVRDRDFNCRVLGTSDCCVVLLHVHCT